MQRMLFAVLICLSFAACGVTHTAYFASGNFWYLQADFDKVNGVVKTTVGFDGGSTPNPTYDLVSSGATDYVETVKVEYNPAVVSYNELLNYFWQHIDPVTKHAQFCDKGAQYRSVIFYSSKEQREQATKSYMEVKKLFSEVSTEILPATQFYPAEAEHQNYYQENPIRYDYYRWSCGRDRGVAEIWQGKSLSLTSKNEKG